MKLYDRLKPEYKEKIDNYQYPFIKQSVLNALEKRYKNDLTILELSIILEACDIYNHSLTALNKLFD